MSIVKVEFLSNKELSVGQKLKGVFIEDKMYYENLPKSEKYIVRLFDNESNSCGFLSRESVFTQYSAKDLVQAIYDLEISFDCDVDFEIIDIKDISLKNKKLFVLKLLNVNIASKILGISVSKKAEISVKKYLDKYKHINIDNRDMNSSNISLKEVILNVKGDSKKNPKRTLITRMIKNLELPNLEVAIDDEGKLRTVYENEYAGEILDIPSDLNIDNIKSIYCNTNIPLGYTVIIQYSSCALPNINCVDNNVLDISNTNEENCIISKRMKADEKELLKIVEYLTNLSIPEELIDKVLDSHEPFEEKYLKRIPHSSDKNFTPWVKSDEDRNLLLLAIIQIEEGFNLRVVGSKGTGKNTFLDTLSWIYQRPKFTQSGSLDVDTNTLVGDKNLEHKIINDSIVQDIGFETGLLIEAMEVGGFFELGEGNACRPGVLMSLHTILDERKFMDVKGYKLVQAHSRFSFMLTMNVDYEGCNDLNQGFRDRFVTLKFLPPKDIKNILKVCCTFATEEHINICNRIYKSILDLASEIQSDEVITVRGYIRALKMSKYVSIDEALQCCITDNISDDAFVYNRVNHIIENIVG